MHAPRMMSQICVAVLLAVAAAGAQEVRVPGAVVFGPRTYTPPPIASPAISLSEAVRLTALHSPALVAKTQTVAQSAGRVQELRGAFDANLVVGPKFKYTYQALAPSVFLLETYKRDAYANLGTIFLALADDFRAQAAGLQPRVPSCPLVYGNLTTSAMAFQVRMPSITGGTGPFSLDQAQQMDDLGLSRDAGSVDSTDSLIAGMGLCSLQAGTRDVGALAAWYHALNPISRIDYSGGYGLAGVLESVQALPREILTSMAQLSDLIGTRGELARQRLGDMPGGALQRMFQIGFTYNKPFRSGLQLGASIQIQAFEDTFQGKSLDPSFGGNATPNRFPTTLTASMTMPLRKGRGAVAVAAPERAARFGVDAQREQLRHATTEEVYRTVLAYLTLAATQETVTLLEESAARQAAIVDMTRQRVEAGEIPLMESNRAQARAAAVTASLLGARSNLATSRVGLAQNIGADGVSFGEMPTAADRLVVVPASIGHVADLVQIAQDRRHDTLALRQLRLASGALDAGARSDLKRKVDLSLSGGLKNTYESPLFRYMPDEVNPIYSDFKTYPPYVEPTRVYDPRGYWRSMTGRYEPFVQTSLTVELPLGNNQARGRAAQTRADVRSREIDIADLTRSIRENIIGATGAVELTLTALERAETAVKADDEMLATTLERFKVGEVTLLDMLMTEEQVTTDKFEVVRLRQSYVSALARLRFETGELVRFITDGTGAEVIAFDPGSILGK